MRTRAWIRHVLSFPWSGPMCAMLAAGTPGPRGCESLNLAAPSKDRNGLRSLIDEFLKKSMIR